MENKAYIVVNEQQEREVLKRLEQERLIWLYSLKKPIAYKPSNYPNIVNFPYVLKVVGSNIVLGALDELRHYEIVYDGRKENKMKIPENIYNMLVEWRDALELKTDYVTGFKLHMLNDEVHEWAADVTTLSDNHNRYIAILQWLNGEDVFEVEKPKKWVVRSKVISTEGSHLYVNVHSTLGIPDIMTLFRLKNATKFDTKEEAQSWANSHQEVIGVK